MADNTMDRMKQTLAAAVRAFVGNRLDYLARYPCVAVTQNGDGTLELQPDDSRLPPLSKVPIRLGVPGMTVKVANGARVLLAFAGGDPQRPVAEVWESGTVTQLNVNANTIILNGGTFPVARATADSAGPYPIVGGNTTVKA